jgi:SagB-type dehydrogenase family enzyme
VRRSRTAAGTSRTSRRRTLCVRRSPHLIAYWRAGTLIACNYATGGRVEVPPKVCELLRACDEWTPVTALADGEFVSREAFPSLVAHMVTLGLLEQSDEPRDPRAVAMDLFQPWNPQVGFFHSTTRDVRYSSREFTRRYTRDRVKECPPPPPVKQYRHAETVALSPPPSRDEFAAVLRARRTWRRYSSEPITRDELGTILGLTAGIQQWVEADAFDIPLKTSPSGGGRHSVECYVVARAVRGLKQGIYYYAPDTHALKRIRGPVPAARLRAYVPGSEYFAKASAMLFFTSVFERLLWRYPYARAYRAALIESGHLCQTFCLTATRLGLAPFCVMALADSLIEQDLGIDGIRESVLYAAGVGRPPRGTAWAPAPTGKAPPLRLNPRFKTR